MDWWNQSVIEEKQNSLSLTFFVIELKAESFQFNIIKHKVYNQKVNIWY